MKRLLVLLIGIIIVSFIAFNPLNKEKGTSETTTSTIQKYTNIFKQDDEATTKNDEISLKELPNQKTLGNIHHVFQTFNNCGPASLSIALSYFDIIESQQSLGQALRPYQNPQGDNDDKSVTLEELAEKAEEFGFVSYHRPAGNIELLKNFVNNDMPVITRTWLKPNEDIGHFRVVKGFDNLRGHLIQDDSLQGKNLRYTYDEFNAIWKKFNYEYLVLVPKNKIEIAEKILGENTEEQVAWTNALGLSQSELAKNPNDVDARFNLSVAWNHVGNHQEAVKEFEKVQNQLSRRTLWYQIEPVLSYYYLEDYDKVFEISDHVLADGNRAFSELYVLRGEIYLKQGKKDLAKQEFEKAVFYNTSLKSAQEALEKVQ